MHLTQRELYLERVTELSLTLRQQAHEQTLKALQMPVS